MIVVTHQDGQKQEDGPSNVITSNVSVFKNMVYALGRSLTKLLVMEHGANMRKGTQIAK